jgi:hypothetical protein
MNSGSYTNRRRFENEPKNPLFAAIATLGRSHTKSHRPEEILHNSDLLDRTNLIHATGVWRASGVLHSHSAHPPGALNMRLQNPQPPSTVERLWLFVQIAEVRSMAIFALNAARPLAAVRARVPAYHLADRPPERVLPG